MGQLCRHLQGWRVLWLRLLRSRWAPGAASSILGQVQDLGGRWAAGSLRACYWTLGLGRRPVGSDGLNTVGMTVPFSLLQRGSSEEW